MSRQSIVGQIYGYGVSLIAVLIILFTIHGIVNNIFRVINPAAGGGGMHVMIMHRVGGPGMEGPGMRGPGMGIMPGGGAMMWGFGRHNRTFGQQPSSGASSAPTATTTAPGAMSGPGMGGPMAMHASMTGEGRFNAIRMLVIDIVMLIVGIVLFRWHWDWLHKTT